jgi:hypothetical protein
MNVLNGGMAEALGGRAPGLVSGQTRLLQLEEVVNGADEAPFAVDRFDAAAAESPVAQGCLDVARLSTGRWPRLGRGRTSR